ncbi:MAG: glycosyltransferase family 2 protein [Chloroflexi bacterium]|nr:glycosyltransferase family 2 protein [Chloroflexota bacterium]
MGKVLLFVLIVAAGAAASLDASERGMFSEPRGSVLVIEGQGPLFSAGDDGLTRGSSGNGRIGLLFAAQSPAVMRDAAIELRDHAVPATFALSAAATIANPSLPGDLRRAGHEIALAGFGPHDSARLPFWLWAGEHTLARRIIEASGAGPVLVYAGERLAAPPFDATGAILARRAAAIGLIPATGVGDLDDPGLPISPTDDPDGILILLGDRAADLSAIRPVVAFIGVHRLIPSRVSDMAAVASDAPSQTGTLLGAVAVWSVQLARAAGALAHALIVVITLLALVRLVIVLIVAVRRSARPERSPLVSGRLAVLVPAYNEEVVIGNTLRAILRSVHTDLEVVVIDDGSGDRTANEARKVAETDERVRVIVQPNGGKSSALNRGLAATTAPYIAVVDADSLVEPEAFGELLRPLSDPKVGAVAGNVKVGNRGGLLGAMQHLEYVVSINLDRRFLDAVDSVMVVPGALGAFRRDVIERAGGFPLNTIAEDADLTVAIGRLGFHTRHSSSARVWTEVPSGWTALRRQRFRWSYGILQVLWKHRGAILSRRATNVGRLGIPYTVMFSYLLPALTPITDLGFVYWLVVGPQAQLVGLYALFLALQLVVGMVALRFDREPMWHALLVVPQRLGYVQLLALVVLSALSAALAGVPVGWGKALRRGLQDLVSGQVRDAEGPP